MIFDAYTGFFRVFVVFAARAFGTLNHFAFSSKRPYDRNKAAWKEQPIQWKMHPLGSTTQPS